MEELYDHEEDEWQKKNFLKNAYRVCEQQCLRSEYSHWRPIEKHQRIGHFVDSNFELCTWIEVGTNFSGRILACKIVENRILWDEWSIVPESSFQNLEHEQCEENKTTILFEDLYIPSPVLERVKSFVNAHSKIIGILFLCGALVSAFHIAPQDPQYASNKQKVRNVKKLDEMPQKKNEELKNIERNRFLDK
jgi:hypothetical protein